MPVIFLPAKGFNCTFGEGPSDIRDDQKNLERILEKRRRESERYFNEVAGRLGKNYCPGRSWEAIGHFLLHLVPNIDIADLGAGEGVLAQLMAKRARKVYCIDRSTSIRPDLKNLPPFPI